MLRELDIDALEQSTEEAAGANAQSAASSYALERLRRELIEGDAALERLFDERPDLDRQRLGQAVRAARREAAAGTSNKRFKELFKLLKTLGLGEAS
jgi:ribosome-associated protein